MKSSIRWVLVAGLVVCVGCGQSAEQESSSPDGLAGGIDCGNDPAEPTKAIGGAHEQQLADLEPGPEPSPSPPIVAAARSQIGRTTIYDGSYARLKYPGGDVPIERGVCTDVVIRALRDAHGIDLQKLVHVDMKANFSKYPKIWGLKRPDKNIDHRRVPNLQTYFKRRGYALRAGREREYRPGDLVTCLIDNLPHIMVISDRTTAGGVPLIIHNYGRGTQEEDLLHEFKITGHYRIKPSPEG